uniref:Uncharacterized protein n=1 Tax=Tanacetum cinerariifolium TaxID=118510 RepID=A0A6L2NAU1_TANCI|nr:hypothetical protein [Tanacetum cinerariifolium]GEW45509.1 hypothetical protein [Tanacetum cinerariifolium]
MFKRFYNTPLGPSDHGMSPSREGVKGSRKVYEGGEDGVIDFGGEKVKEVSRHMVSLDLKWQRQLGLENEGANDNINSAYHSFGFAVLLGCFGARETKLYSVIVEWSVKFVIIKLTTIVTLKTFDFTLKLIFNAQPLRDTYTIELHRSVMSDASSAVTYTSVYADSDPWRYYEEDSTETGPPRVIVYGYDGLPIEPVALPSPDYVPGPEHPPSSDYVLGREHPPSPIEIPYVPEPEYPEYLAPSDDEAPLEDQPLPADALPIAASPDYVADSDPEED